MPEYTRFKGVTEIGDSTCCDQLKANLVKFFEWGLLGIGGFTNVTINSSGAYDGDASVLRYVDDPNYSSGQVWEGHRNDWVWESGVEYDYQPITVSGVVVNNTFYSSGTTGAYAHKVDYPLGRIIFDDPLPTGSVVKAQYSYRYASFYTSDAPWFKEVMFNSYRVDDEHFLQNGSGVWSTLSQNRVQLPAVIVETVPRRNLTPYQIGGGHWVQQDVLFHIISEEPWNRDKLLDIITYQKEKTILSFDKNRMAEEDSFPLDYDGSLRSGAMMYPDLVKSSGEGGFFWKKIFFKNMTSQESTSVPPLYRAIVRGTFEIDFPEL